MKSELMKNLIEFSNLKKELFKDSNFIELDLNNPKHKRYNDLALVYIKFINYLKGE